MKVDNMGRACRMNRMEKSFSMKILRKESQVKTGG
jgi:hypothetical protein